MRSAPQRVAILLLLFLLSLGVLPARPGAADSNAAYSPTTLTGRSAWLGPNAMGVFVRKMVEGRAVCIEASAEQARTLRSRDPNLALITFDSGGPQTGLKITLRSTLQLQNFFPAREAFRRAAAQWEALIQNQITVVIDVDFGSTFFGKPFDDTTVGIADSQVLGGNALYPSVRGGMTSRERSSDRMGLYDSLPSKTVSTDRGDSAGIVTPSAALRALRIIKPVADPPGELSKFGAPPAIAFNSKFSFDFDSVDGVDKDKLDFESLVVHEMGHVLGFVSAVGQQEIDPGVDPAPSIWDLFRFRPDAIQSSFTTAQRILTSGGDQSFYSGDATLALSSGRPDAQGGDGRQPSHWKDDELTGRYPGVMDPTAQPGEHQTITDNDITALDTLSYRSTANSDPFLIPLLSGVPTAGGMIAPPLGFGFLSHTQYSIAVPAGATRLKIDLNGNQDVDLFVRFGQRVVIQGVRATADYQSRSSSGSESVIVLPSSSPPLAEGTYYIAVANFGPGEASFSVTATVSGVANTRPPAVFSLAPHLDGDVLAIDYAAVDLEADLVRTDVAILDDLGRSINTSSLPINSAVSAMTESRLSINGLRLFPSALRASVVLIDRLGNRSADAVADFSGPEPGGLLLNGASFDGARLVLKVSGLLEDLSLEINGRTVALKIKAKGSGNKLIVNGDFGQLGLQPGPNRIRVKNINGWSGIVILRI